MAVRICIVTSWFPHTTKKGLTPFVYSFAKDLIKWGYDVYVITVLHKGDQKYHYDEGLKIYRIKTIFSLISIQNLILKINPDLVHVQAPNSFSSLALIVCKIKKKPIIATVHRAEIDTINPFFSAIRKWILNQYSLIVAVSEFSRSLAIQAGVHTNKLKVIYNSCNEFIFCPGSREQSRKNLNIPLNINLILFVGNLVKIKGVFTFVRTLIELKKKTNFHAIIIGKGVEEEAMKKIIETENLKHLVKFAGWIPQEQLPDYYRAANVVVAPSFVEGHSVALLEALSCGTPIVASKIGGNLETIQDKLNGFLAPSDNPKVFSDYILLVLQDPELATAISNANIITYRDKFGKSKQLNKYESIYKILINRREN